MDPSGRWTHGIVLSSPIWTSALGIMLDAPAWYGACVPAVAMPFMAVLAAVMGATHLLDRPRSWWWGIGMLAAAVALFFFGFGAYAWTTIDGARGPCIPYGWERWPWLY